MKRLIPFFFLLVSLLPACKKTESDSLWERTFGLGEAFFLQPTSDSGFVACGEADGKPYFILLDYKKRKLLEFYGEKDGSFNSVWYDTSGYTSAGNTEGKMLLTHHSTDGNVLWEKIFDVSFNLDFTSLFYTGNGTLLAIGTASPDSLDSNSNGLLFVRFDTTGQILEEKSITETNMIAARGAHVDNEGNIFLALTRKTGAAKSKASVAKYNNLYQKLWETELYNNPEFGSASYAIRLDETGNVFVAGKTELSAEDGILNNSFLASLTNAGVVRWKNYLENSNQGSAIIFDEMDNVLMLNRNCFIISKLSSDTGTDEGRIRMFNLCDPYNTDALGSCFAINYDDNMLVGGSRGGNFYLALKSLQ